MEKMPNPSDYVIRPLQVSRKVSLLPRYDSVLAGRECLRFVRCRCLLGDILQLPYYSTTTTIYESAYNIRHNGQYHSMQWESGRSLFRGGPHETC